MQIDTSGLYIIVWFLLAAFYIHRLYKIHRKQEKLYKEQNKEYNFFSNPKILKFGIGGIVVLLIFAMVMPVRQSLNESKNRVNFTNTFEEVTEEDKIRHGVDLSDEARASRLEELRLQNQKLSEEVHENEDNDNSQNNTRSKQ
jgi:hypothetical protein